MDARARKPGACACLPAHACAVAPQRWPASVSVLAHLEAGRRAAALRLVHARARVGLAPAQAFRCKLSLCGGASRLYKVRPGKFPFKGNAARGSRVRRGRDASRRTAQPAAADYAHAPTGGSILLWRLEVGRAAGRSIPNAASAIPWALWAARAPGRCGAARSSRGGAPVHVRGCSALQPRARGPAPLRCVQLRPGSLNEHNGKFFPYHSMGAYGPGVRARVRMVLL